MAVWTPWLRASVEKKRQDLMVGIGAGAAGTLALVGALAMIIPSESEGIYDGFRELDFSTEKSRAENVVETELELKEVVDDWTFTRKFVGWGSLVVGSLLSAASGIGIYKTATLGQQPGFSAYGLLGVGLASTGMGIYALTGFRYPVERTWELYQSGTTVLPRPSVDDKAEVSLVPTIGVFGDSITVGIAGSF